MIRRACGGWRRCAQVGQLVVVQIGRKQSTHMMDQYVLKMSGPANVNVHCRAYSLKWSATIHAYMRAALPRSGSAPLGP